MLSANQFSVPAGSLSGTVTLTELSLSGSKTAKMTLTSGSTYALSSSVTSTVTLGSASPTPTPTPTPTPSPSPVPTATPSSNPTQECWIAVRTDGLPGSGTQSDPYNGSTAAKFDTIMGSFQGLQNLGIHLIGAGPFRTDLHHPWTVQTGWIISGDGIDVTTVQLTGNASGVSQACCIASNPNFATNNVTITNLTIDCNWSALSSSVAVGANHEKSLLLARFLYGEATILSITFEL